MLFKQFTYSNAGTEIQFMQGLIDLICGLDDDITCEDANGNATTAAAQFADLTSASRADFFFNFNNSYKVEFRRGTTNNNSGKNYNIYKQGSGIASLNFSASNYSPTAAATRSLFVTYIKNENVILLYLGSYNINSLENAQYSLLRIKANNDVFLGDVNSTAIMGVTLAGANSSGIFSTILPYSCQAGSIDIIEKSVFTSGGAKQFDLADIWSCSTVSLLSNIALPNGKNYLAVGTNAIVEIENETENT